MDVNYYLADPTGNITALVMSRPGINVERVAQKIMESEKSVEQVGFVDFSDGISLRMSGDEFCGNATMSAAALYYSLSGKSGEYETHVSVYGTGDPVGVRVKGEKNYFDCECSVSGPDEIREAEFKACGSSYRFPLVCFKGIMHIVADETLSEEAAKSVIKELAENLGAKALGIMLLEDGKRRMSPIVYVSKTGTLFRENSCASGSCAVAAVTGKKGEKIALLQPGGTLYVMNSDRIYLSGRVRLSKCFSKEI